MIEVVVGIGVVGLLLAILMPAVMAARSAARRLECQSRLREIGIAVANYESHYSVVPAAGFAGHLRMLFPSLGYPNFFGPNELNGDNFDPERDGRASDVLICPADELAQPQAGHTNYGFCDGSGLFDAFKGVMKFGTGRELRDVTDGLSNTAFVSERLIGLVGARWNEAWWLFSDEELEDASERVVWYIPDEHRLDNDWAGFTNDCENHRLTPRPFMGLHEIGWQNSHGYNHLLPPNSNSCFDGPPASTTSERLRRLQHGALPPTSRHRGGVNVLFGDGSVRFISENVDAVAWRAAGTIAGGEPQTGNAL